MIIKKWLQTLFKGDSNVVALPEKLGKGRITGPKPLLDVAQEAMRQEAAHLQGLVAHGAANAREKRLKEKVRKKVAKVIDPVYSSPDIIEEVTEKIVLAATIDPHYEELVKAFEKEESKES
ncbi:MAG: hypothetical protein COV45_08345 [Deltaproteobacteria bacterium CG11_big_fil_rev_8_21_14_0_20_47_16]|nr:MAG: hypothetical protein COV45_08345 [Deltaproteobacteria bacterium CG11_big_fil_rev_8_21_14_0_20_47_16]